MTPASVEIGVMGALQRAQIVLVPFIYSLAKQYSTRLTQQAWLRTFSTLSVISAGCHEGQLSGSKMG
jgi:hypothetical protein